MIPYKTPIIFEKLMPSRMWRQKDQAHTIFLTFDDGPIPELTEWVLDILQEQKALGTFFCVGDNIEKSPDIFQRIINEGHSVGNHSQHHLNGWKTNNSDYVKDVNDCQATIKAHHGETKLFRPPYGRLRWQQKKALDNYQVVMWDVLSKDYQQSLDAEEILKACIDVTESGSIIVFHDNAKAEKNIKYVLPKYIRHFKSKGFSFKAL